MASRILLVIVSLLSILFLPFWVSALLAFAGLIYFSVFWEVIALFFLSDLLYGAERVNFYGITFITTLVATLLLLAAELLKKKLKFYPNN